MGEVTVVVTFQAKLSATSKRRIALAADYARLKGEILRAGRDQAARRSRRNDAMLVVLDDFLPEATVDGAGEIIPESQAATIWRYDGTGTKPRPTQGNEKVWNNSQLASYTAVTDDGDPNLITVHRDYHSGRWFPVGQLESNLLHEQHATAGPLSTGDYLTSDDGTPLRTQLRPTK